MALCRNVMLVDDDEVFNLITEHTLKLYDFTEQVLIFTSVEDGLSYLNEVADKEVVAFPDIIFLDINMPVQSGWDFLDDYRKFPEEVKSRAQLYMLSSSIDESDVLKSQKYEDVRDFIRKPLAKMNLDIIRFRLENEVQRKGGSFL